MKKKIAAIVLIITILSIHICYQQFEREMDVENSFSYSSANFKDENIRVNLNKVIVTGTKEDIAADIIQRVLDNNFHTIRFNFDKGYPNRLRVTVYKNEKDIESGDIYFSFTYGQADNKEIGAHDISQADYMKLIIDDR